MWGNVPSAAEGLASRKTPVLQWSPRPRRKHLPLQRARRPRPASRNVRPSPSPTVIVPPPENPPPRRTAPPAAAPLIRPVQAASPPENAHASIMDESILDDYEERRADRRKHSIFSLIFASSCSCLESQRVPTGTSPSQRATATSASDRPSHQYVTPHKSPRMSRASSLSRPPPSAAANFAACCLPTISRPSWLSWMPSRLQSRVIWRTWQRLCPPMPLRSLGRIMVLSDAQAASTATRSMTAIADSLYHGIIDLYLNGFASQAIAVCQHAGRRGSIQGSHNDAPAR